MRIFKGDKSMNITVETTITAPIATVWTFYNTPEHIKNWNAASDDWHTTASAVDLREGGHFSSRMEAKDGSMGFDFAGTFTKIIEHELIEYAFGERNAVIQFAETADGIKLSVTFEAETTFSLEQQQQGWQAILNNFKRYVESAD
jgi:uncharacterized protein YndB with AHSA1/START domain